MKFNVTTFDLVPRGGPVCQAGGTVRAQDVAATTPANRARRSSHPGNINKRIAGLSFGCLR